MILTQDYNALAHFDWADLGSGKAYELWRRTKLEVTEKALQLAPVQVPDMANPTESERVEIENRCRLVNFARYDSASVINDSDASQKTLRAFAAAFGLQIAENHRSAAETGIVALRVSNAPTKVGYIPYSTRPMNWHTDGYYNAPDDQISGFVLHCVQQALEGGENSFLDPEIAYLRLRDIDPRYISALMQPDAMVIPENRESDGSLRPASVGPVFFPDPASGRLQMRYTARTRSIEWKADPLVNEAQSALRALLIAGDPLALTTRLSAGQGILNNNILHNRTGFTDGQAQGATRIVYRVRFHNRIGGTRHGET